MDIKKQISRVHFRKHRRKKGDTDQLAAQLAPLEEQDKPAAEQQFGSHLETATGQQQPDYGAIVVDNANLNVPKAMIEGEEKHFLGMEPVVLVVLIIMLGYIAFIAWQISLMPAR